jgi:hypothetical protein
VLVAGAPRGHCSTRLVCSLRDGEVGLIYCDGNGIGPPAEDRRIPECTLYVCVDLGVEYLLADLDELSDA